MHPLADPKFPATSPAGNTYPYFQTLLKEWRLAPPSHQAAIEQKLWDTFGQTRAILILDMSSFSKTANSQGILTALAMIQHMNAIAVPQLEAQGGQIVKLEADNIFAVFSTVDAAVTASFSTFSAVQAEGLNVAIGIGYGPILLIEDPTQPHDFFGDEVNLASKLGEDTASGGELMITAEAYRQLANPHPDWQQFHLAISGIEMIAYQWQF